MGKYANLLIFCFLFLFLGCGSGNEFESLSDFEDGFRDIPWEMSIEEALHAGFINIKSDLYQDPSQKDISFNNIEISDIQYAINPGGLYQVIFVIEDTPPEYAYDFNEAKKLEVKYAQIVNKLSEYFGDYTKQLDITSIPVSPVDTFWCGNDVILYVSLRAKDTIILNQKKYKGLIQIVVTTEKHPKVCN